MRALSCNRPKWRGNVMVRESASNAVAENEMRLRELNHGGWTKLTASEMLAGYGSPSAASKQLLRLFFGVPLDPYCANSTKRRRYLQYRVYPRQRVLTVVPPVFDDARQAHFSYYFQDAGVNPEDGGALRGFYSVATDYHEDPLLHHLIWRCFDLTRWEDVDRPKIAGLHVVAYVPTATTPSVASPNLFHQDGEPYTFCILYERRNISGGENYIGLTSAANKALRDVNPSHILDQFTLHEPFETYGVFDPKISHYVAPHQRADTNKEGVRNVLLLDFTEVK